MLISIFHLIKFKQDKKGVNPTRKVSFSIIINCLQVHNHYNAMSFWCCPNVISWLRFKNEIHENIIRLYLINHIQYWFIRRSIASKEVDSITATKTRLAFTNRSLRSDQDASSQKQGRSGTRNLASVHQ